MQEGMALNAAPSIGAICCELCSNAHSYLIYSSTVRSGDKSRYRRLNADVKLISFSQMFRCICVQQFLCVAELRVWRPVPALMPRAVTMTACYTLCDGPNASSGLASC